MKHKGLIICISLVLFLNHILQAQEVVLSSGGDATGAGGSVSYSVGQIVYTTNLGSSGSVSQGVQQAFEISVVSGIESAKYIGLECTTYPNPTSNFVTLKFSKELNQANYTAVLYDFTGKVLLSKIINDSETTISMENLVPAAYLLKVMQVQEAGNKIEIKTFKIIKN